MNRNMHLWILGVSAIGLISIYLVSPGLRQFLQDAVYQLADADVAGFRDYLLSFGVWAPFVSALFMVMAVVVKLVPEKTLYWADVFFSRYGLYAVIISRIVPVFSYGMISYAAGLTSIKLAAYVLGTAIGQTPATILYSYLGEHVTNSVKVLFWTFAIVIVMTVVASAVKRWLDRKKSEQESH